MVERLRIYRELVRAQVRGQSSYRVSFVLDLLGNLLFFGSDLIAVLVVFRQVPALGGFTLRETLVVFGLAATGFALADLFVGNIERMKTYVRTGLLDAVLIRPLGVLGQLLTLDVGVRRIGRVVYSAALLVVALRAADVQLTPARVVMLVLTPVCGAVFFGSFFVATSTVAFWWVESGELSSSLTYGGRDFTAYPMPVYGTWLRRFFGFTLGFGFASYYPSLVVLGRADPLGAPAWLSWSGPAVAALAATAAWLIWRTGVRHYRSTGS
ncbi:ABC transporter permease [Catellatospora tritici]|uniref:ABC transporter permease n=1 Tax=Catellatospora tritici TaxID=2851566 RepID=UPI001C2DED54|nr:ABC-2 family transporter protein [Catellatospora tritici]MBV1852575.1 ABC-2 family transporter protein [Catellatospora tritici]